MVKNIVNAVHQSIVLNEGQMRYNYLVVYYRNTLSQLNDRRWLLGGVMVKASDLRSSGQEFHFRPGRYRAT